MWFDFFDKGSIRVAVCPEESSLLSLKGRLQLPAFCGTKKISLTLMAVESDGKEMCLFNGWCSKDASILIHFATFGLTVEDLLDHSLAVSACVSLKANGGDNEDEKRKILQSNAGQVLEDSNGIRFELPNYESETYGTSMSIGQCIELLSLTQSYMLDLLNEEEHMDALTKVFKEKDVSVRQFHKNLFQYEQCKNTKEMLRVDAVLIYPLLRQLKWKLSFDQMVRTLMLLYEMEVPLSFLFVLETIIQSKEIVSEKTSVFKEQLHITGCGRQRQEIISTLPLLRTVMRAIVDTSSDADIDDCVLCISRYLEDMPLSLEQPIVKARHLTH
jgi:hypothetical protein